MRRRLRTLGMILLVLACGTVAVIMNTGTGILPGGAAAPESKPIDITGKKLKLTWHDEFTGAYGARPDTKKWKVETGKSTVGELQENVPGNVATDGKGHLVIAAKRVGKKYTSARVTTEGRFETTYGRVSARLKSPNGQGLLSALWMLGTNFRQKPWPECGEIDLMERRGHLTRRVDATLQGPGYSGVGLNAHHNLPAKSADFGSAFHVFTLDWTPDQIDLKVDGEIIQSTDRKGIPGKWVFDHPFFLVMNVAVGGVYAGPPDAATKFPAKMIVDYVRAYQYTG